MILCLDVGNSQIFGGIYKDNNVLLRFRKISTQGASSDEYGLFLKSVIRENKIDPDDITQIAICSVVPDLIYSLKNCCKKYFGINPFVLEPGAKSGLKINYRNPLEVGADRISNAIAATHLYPNKNLIVLDFGTATTLCAISKKKEYLGGVILAGMKISMEALETRTAKLPKVEIIKSKSVLGRATVESIQSGLYHGHYASCKYMTEKLIQECFKGEETLVIGTGGFSSLYDGTDLFDIQLPDLVLTGLHVALKINSNNTRIKKSDNKEVQV